ncbi:VOC family protein [Roseomonas elaeocarpi]|uniref:VOC family protein n=1 Tax=Roseomonas elaeocarpi TaxID=907779 RepID=A0ABV6JQL0_9PROT
MAIPEVVRKPPFNITRASHVYLTVRDLDASRRFYTEILGLVVSAQEGGTLYLRGIEEACHHSLVLRQDDAPPACDAVGMRVTDAEELALAEDHFARAGITARRVERPYENGTLRVTFDDRSPPVELCAGMPLLPRLLNDYPAQKGGRALRLDHYQCVVPDVDATAAHFMALGFRPSKFTTSVETGQIVSIFLHRKNNPHDIVLAQGGGPRLHHFCYIVSDLAALLRACDVAASFGLGRNVEHGIGRHGPPNGVFAYLRDPDGHRIELGLPPMQYMDAEERANTWDSNQGQALIPWGALPPQRWREEASSFAGVDAGEAPAARWLPQV